MRRIRENHLQARGHGYRIFDTPYSDQLIDCKGGVERADG